MFSFGAIQTNQVCRCRSCLPSQGSSVHSTWSANYTNCPDLVAIFFCLPISVHNTNLRNSFCIMVYDGTEHLLGHKQPWLEEKTHPNIYNGKVCECCSQTSKQVNIVVTRMRGPSGPVILVKYIENNREDKLLTMNMAIGNMTIWHD